MTLVERLEPGITVKRKGAAVFDVDERPSTLQLQAFCNRYGTGGGMRKMMAASIGLPQNTFDDYYYGKRDRQIPASSWTLLRITWDSLALAEWQKRRPQHE